MPQSGWLVARVLVPVPWARSPYFVPCGCVCSNSNDVFEEF